MKKFKKVCCDISMLLRVIE